MSDYSYCCNCGEYSSHYLDDELGWVCVACKHVHCGGCDDEDPGDYEPDEDTNTEFEEDTTEAETTTETEEE